MSLFECIDKADNALKYLCRQNNLLDQTYLFFSLQTEKGYEARKQREIVLFRKIRDRLLKEQELLEANSQNYSHLATLLDDLVPEIKAYLKTTSPIFSSDLSFILKELALVAKDLGPSNYHLLTRLSKYENNHHKIADAYQGGSALGTSGGMCYGMTSMMAVPHLSPYLILNTAENERPHIAITRKIYEDQNNQLHEKDDQNLIKKTLLTRSHFCFNKIQQAKEILKHAKAYPSKDLMLHLKSLKGLHACYLRINMTSSKKQEIWYMDPNHGAYRFNTEAEFIEFYALSLKNDGFSNYQLSEMQYDPDNKLSRKRSFWDIWFSILTGRHYQTYEGISGKMLFLLYCTTSALPINFLPESIASLSMLFFPPAVALAVHILVSVFCIAVILNGYQGILGPIHFFEECCCQLNAFVNSFMGASEEAALEKEVDEVLNDSSFSMA